MQLMQIDLQGFRRLTNRSFSFKPGFNLVYGPNESGKSTLQGALLASLYSLYDEGVVTSERRESIKQIQPWDEDAIFGANLNYRLDDGQRYQVKRVFGPVASTRLIALPDNTDVTANYEQLSDGRVLFANAQLGVDRPFFERVCVVNQAELAHLNEESLSLNDAIVRIFASINNDVTINEALDLLNATLQNDVGTERTRTRPLPAARNRLEQAEADFAASQAGRVTLYRNMAEIKTLHIQLGELQLERVKSDYLYRLALAQMYRHQLSRAEEWETEAQQYANEMGTLDKWASFPDHLYDQLLELTARRDQLKTIIAEYPGEAAEIGAAWQAAQQKRDEAESAVNAAESALQTAQQRLNDHPQATELGADGLTKLRDRLTAARDEAAAAESALKDAQSAWEKAGITEAAFAELAARVADLRESMKPARGLSGLFSRPKKPTSEQEQDIAAHDEHAEAYQALLTARENLETAGAAVNAAVEEAAQTLGLSNESDVNQAVTECQTRLDRLEDVARAKQASSAARATLKASDDELQAASANWDDNQRQLYQIESDIRRVLDEADVKSNLDEAVALFREGRGNRTRWQTAKDRYDRVQRDLSMAQAEIAQARAALIKLDGDLERLRIETPTFAGLDVNLLPQEYEERLTAATQQYDNAREQIARLERDVESLRVTLKHPAALAEETGAARREVQRLEAFGAALESAISELEAATRQFQQQMMPRLEALIGENLDYATEGRYQAVKINPDDLSVTLLSPGSKAAVGTDVLSTSTQDLIYLLLRLSIAQFISTTGERLPILLDDPLVHYDNDRRQRALEVLLRVADRMQLVLFTQDAWTRQWAEAHCEDCVIALDL